MTSVGEPELLPLRHRTHVYLLSRPGISTGSNGLPVARSALPLDHFKASAGLREGQRMSGTPACTHSLAFAELGRIGELAGDVRASSPAFTAGTHRKYDRPIGVLRHFRDDRFLQEENLA